jgi:hypothetical protein
MPHTRPIFGPERRLGLIERSGVPGALVVREIERHAPEPYLVVGIHPIDAPDIAVAVEHVIVLVLPMARNA